AIRIGGPQFLRSTSGASVSAIAELERTAGLPLQPLHRGYLAKFGAKEGPLSGGDPDGRVESLLAFYREESETGRTSIPDGWIIIGVGALLPNYALFAGGDASTRVVHSSDGGIDWVIADSFANHVYGRAFAAARSTTRERPTYRKLPLKGPPSE